MKEKMPLKKIAKFTILVLVLSLIMGAVIRCSYTVQRDLDVLVDKNIEDVSHQNAQALQSEIKDKQNLLNNMITIVQDTTRSESDRYMILEKMVEGYGLKRAGICQTDGSTTGTDGTFANLSERQFFKDGMKGKSSISSVLRDAMGKEKEEVIVMTSPLMKNGTVTGVFGMTYDADVFSQSLLSSSFAGNGYCCVINQYDQVVVSAGNDNIQVSKNFFQDVVGKDSDNNEVANTLRDAMEKKISASGTIKLGENNYYHATPVTLLDGDVTWYVVTFVPTSYFQAREDSILGNLKKMNIVVFIFILVGLLIYLLINRKQEKTIQSLAYIDPTTGSDNYARFLQKMGNLRIREGSYVVALQILNFDNANIAVGKVSSDELLKKIAEILEDALIEGELSAHTRDEVFVLYFGPMDTSLLLRRLNRISEKIKDLAKDNGISGIFPNYGIYRMEPEEKASEAYAKAKLAVTFIQEGSGKSYAFYSELDRQQLVRRQELEENFDSAIANRNFEVWFQPKYSPDGILLMGSEALIRWRDNDGNLISPGEFIPLFEQNGYIAKLDEYVFRMVCEHQKYWRDNGYEIRPVSINLSRASLYHAGLVDRYLAIMEEYEMDSDYIQIEITESAIHGKKKITDILEDFRSHGIRILMDDFGTGYSSLSTLNLNCFDTLKLDKSLIDYIGDEKGEILLDHVINMGHELGLHITAEGVENGDQLTYLCRLKCDDIQGFYFARPMPASNFEEKIMSRCGS